MSNVKNVVATWLPIFSGFNANEWDTEFQVDMYCEENDVDYDVLDIKYEQFRNDLAPLIVKAVAHELSDYGVDTITLEDVIVSHSGYTSDSINCEIAIDPVVIREYIYENKMEFISYLKSQYTSYDGFSSFHSTNFDDWVELTNNFQFDKKFDDFFDARQSTHYLGSVLQFIAQNEELTEQDVSEYITQKLDCVFIEDYITIEK